MTRTVATYRQMVPIDRLFMTHLETRQFNHPFRESEAVLICAIQAIWHFDRVAFS
jgi:hypothetical protein